MEGYRQFPYNKKEFNDDYLWPKELKNFLSQFVNYKHFNNLHYINSVFKHIGFKSYLKNRFYRAQTQILQI